MNNAKEILKLIDKQWCNVDDIRAIAQTSKKNAQNIKREIKTRLESKGYIVPSYLVPTTSVIEYLKIDIPYLESRAKFMDEINNK